MKLLSRAQLLVTAWTTAYQAPPSMGFSRQEYWSGLPLPYTNYMYQFSSVQFSCSVMSDSLQPHGLQPTRLPRPWDSPGKNTGVGCRFLLQCMKVKSESEVAQSCPTLRDPMDCSLPGSSIHGVPVKTQCSLRPAPRAAESVGWSVSVSQGVVSR